MTSPVPESNDPSTESPAKTNSYEHNLGQLRKLLEKEREDKNALYEKHKQMEKNLAALTSPKEEEEEDDSDEPYVDPKTLRKHLKNFESKFDSLIDQRAEQKARSIMEEDKRNSYLKTNSDFYTTMTEHNVEKFATDHPQIAEAILKMPDNFERQKLVYENMKALNKSKEQATQSSIQTKINENKKNLYYLPSTQGSPAPSMVGDYSAVGQKTAYDQMQALKKRLSGSR